MKREERGLFCVVLGVLAVALSLLLIQSIRGTGEPPIYRVSVLTDGTESDYWENFRSGVNQAALEHNVDVRFITAYEGEPGRAQPAALRREWEGEADGVVVIPAAGDGQLFTDAPTRLAAAVMGPKPEKAKGAVCYVSADYDAMGARLGDTVAEMGAETCTLYLSPSGGAASSRLRFGLYRRLEELHIDYDAVAVNPAQLNTVAERGALVAVEPGMTEALCRNPRAAGRVCGVGASGRLLHYLEDGTAAALVVQSDFDAGYLSLTRVVELLDGGSPRDTVLDCYTATAENMFEEPMIQILFATT
ncbi:MAG: hypothetical protein RR426_07985 [Oscillospiraceae bacterium]